LVHFGQEQSETSSSIPTTRTAMQKAIKEDEALKKISLLNPSILQDYKEFAQTDTKLFDFTDIMHSLNLNECESIPNGFVDHCIRRFQPQKTRRKSERK